jgi:uncharacterized MnhB-related membrane protein
MNFSDKTVDNINKITFILYSLVISLSLYHIVAKENIYNSLVDFSISILYISITVYKKLKSEYM